MLKLSSLSSMGVGAQTLRANPLRTVLSTLGIIIGVASPVYAAFTWSTVFVAAAAAILVGIAFGTYPARRAANLSPIDSIRHE